MSYLSIIDDYGMDFRSQAEEEAYKAGCRHGYERAMKEVHGDMGQRDRMGYRGGNIDEMDERRRRDSRGRYM